MRHTLDSTKVEASKGNKHKTDTNALKVYNWVENCVGQEEVSKLESNTTSDWLYHIWFSQSEIVLVPVVKNLGE